MLCLPLIICLPESGPADAGGHEATKSDPLQKKTSCLVNNTKLNLVVRFQFQSSGECGVLFHCHCSHIHSDSEGYFLVWFYGTSTIVGYSMRDPFLYIYIKDMGFNLVWFHGISTIVGYLIPNPFLYIKTVQFQTIQISISTQFKCENSSISIYSV